jgi:cytochrome c-type biogenesis protein
VLLATLYLGLGIVYLTGQAGRLTPAIGPRLGRLSTMRGAAALAVLVGLNIPACATPLLAVVLGAATLTGSGRIGRGFVMLAMFGLALSLPLLVALACESARRALDRLSALSGRVPVLIGIVLAVLGLWSIDFGLFARS